MEIKRQSYFSRLHLLRMAMLSQRAVEYSIKAHEFGNSDICRLFWKHEQEWYDLQRCIGDLGRTFVAAGISVDDSPIADGALRIYSALYVTYTAASEIAHVCSLMFERELTTQCPRLAEIARFTNRLVRSSTVALFRNEAQHAKTILHDHLGWRWFELELCHAHNMLMQNPGAQAGFELAIARALGQIAEQSYELAKASTLWREADDGFSPAREKPSFAA